MEIRITIAYNMEEQKIGCVLLQPVMGTIPSGQIAQNFGTGTWELNPSKVKLYTVKNEEEWEKIIQITNSAHKTIS